MSEKSLIIFVEMMSDGEIMSLRKGGEELIIYERASEPLSIHHIGYLGNTTKPKNLSSK